MVTWLRLGAIRKVKILQTLVDAAEAVEGFKEVDIKIHHKLLMIGSKGLQKCTSSFFGRPGRHGSSIMAHIN
uniref:Uncharacterized protein n=1 Tax=Cannabis sativa TaxID=3483 RepID=A0A803PKK8_CANSA